jgi:tRNA modification GTPase
MNALLDKDRAIVSPTPGTTRDVLEDHFRLNGLHLKVSDTAGIRETVEGIEQEGIRRSKQALKEADIILLVLDAHQGVTEEDCNLIDLIPPTKTIAVWNKIDLPHRDLPTFPFPWTVHLSAKELPTLKRRDNDYQHSTQRSLDCFCNSCKNGSAGAKRCCLT